MAASWLHPLKCPVYVTCSHISQSLFPHHVCAIALLCHVCVFVCVCVHVDVYASCPYLLPPPPRRLGVCTPPTVLVPTSEPPGTTTKAPSPPSGMYPHHHHLHQHHHHRPPHLPPTTPNHSASTLPEKTNQLFLFFPSSPSFSHFLPNLYVPPSPLFFLPHFTLLIVSYIIILFILSTLHVVCLA